MTPSMNFSLGLRDPGVEGYKRGKEEGRKILCEYRPFRRGKKGANPCIAHDQSWCLM